MDKSKDVFLRVAEDIGLIVGGLIFLFAVLIGVVFLAIGGLHLSPNDPVGTYVCLALIFIIFLFPFWWMYRRRAQQHPQEATRIQNAFNAYAMIRVLGAILGMGAAITYVATMYGAFSYGAMGLWILLSVLFILLAFRKIKKGKI